MKKNELLKQIEDALTVKDVGGIIKILVAMKRYYKGHEVTIWLDINNDIENPEVVNIRLTCPLCYIYNNISARAQTIARILFNDHLTLIRKTISFVNFKGIRGGLKARCMVCPYVLVNKAYCFGYWIEKHDILVATARSVRNEKFVFLRMPLLDEQIEHFEKLRQEKMQHEKSS